MAWHILRKDLALLWPIVLLGALAQWALFALVFAMDAFPQQPYLRPLAQLGTFAVFLSIVFIVALGVQQEPIPGTRQDWLVRPIRRRDLLIAKLLFVLLAVHLPMLIGDAVQVLAHGFSFGEAVERRPGAQPADFRHRLPAGPCLRRHDPDRGPVRRRRHRLLHRHRRRHPTTQPRRPPRGPGAGHQSPFLDRCGLDSPDRWTDRDGGGARPLHCCCSISAAGSPWRGAYFPPWPCWPRSPPSCLGSWIFAVQQTAQAAPAGPPVTVAFDPASPRYRPAPGESADIYAPGAGQVQLRGREAGDVPAETRARAAQGDVALYLPLRIRGLQAGDRPWVDRAVLRLKDAGGQVVFEGRGDDLKLDRTASGPGGALVYEAVRIPGLVFQQAKDRPLTVEIDVSLTVLSPQPVQTIAALGADQRLPRLGRCTSGRDSDGDEIELRCLTPANPPSCMAAALDDPATGRRNPDVLICAPNYAPYATRSFPDAFSRFEVEAPFRDRLGLGSYPVGPEQLGRARVRADALRGLGSPRAAGRRGLRPPRGLDGVSHGAIFAAVKS